MTKEKIAIIGGGMGGLSAAFRLSNTEEQRKKFDITIYQMGWRLGGKCAAGRNQAPGMGMRIEEHGIHAFLGSYYNALPMMKDVFDELQRPKTHPLPDFQTAFPRRRTAFQWEYHDGKMKKWPKGFKDNCLSVNDGAIASRLSHWAFAFTEFINFLMPPKQKPPKGKGAHAKGWKIVNEFHDQFDIVLDKLEKLNESPDFQALQLMNKDNGSSLLPCPPQPQPQPKIPWHIYNDLLKPVQWPAGTQNIDIMRRACLTMEYLQVVLRGVRDDDLETKGFAIIDDEDFDEWLVRHGASQDLMKSPLVVSTVNITYQYPEGDLGQKPVMSAASYVQWVLRTGSFMGAAYYLFAAGSGETLIVPLYECLKKRGVKFALFHELKDIQLDKSGGAVKKLVFNKQAEPKKGTYDPLIPVKGLDAWPNMPLFDRLVDGENLTHIDFEAPNAIKGRKITCIANKDFDKIILAIPPRAIKGSAPSLVKACQAWKTVSEMSAVRTQSMQLWLKDTTKSYTGHTEDLFVAANYRTGMQGMVDFEELLQFEDWKGKNKPSGLMYFSGVLTKPQNMKGISEREMADLKARHNAEAILTASAVEVFPSGIVNDPVNDPFCFDYDNLFAPSGKGVGVERLQSQYIRGNVLPSELYTLSPPGTIRERIDPLNPPQPNMTAAGDWVNSRLNVGSVEGTVMGGFLSASFIDNSLPVKDIHGVFPTT